MAWVSLRFFLSVEAGPAYLTKFTLFRNREILRLDSFHYSPSTNVGSSHRTVKDLLDAAIQKNITWHL
jgi:hypothetical protein